jgi:hypothetical protein
MPSHAPTSKNALAVASIASADLVVVTAPTTTPSATRRLARTSSQSSSSSGASTPSRLAPRDVPRDANARDPLARPVAERARRVARAFAFASLPARRIASWGAEKDARVTHSRAKPRVARHADARDRVQ